MTSLDNADPSVVFVHGAYADGSSWSEVIRLLHQAGIAVTAVQNPLTSLANDVAHTRRILARQPGPVILAGHSFGGTVISEAGTHPAVVALVYVAARAPDAAASMMEGRLVRTERAADLLQALLRPGDRVALDGDNQKQADFLARSLTQLDPANVHDLHLLISSVSLPEHLDVFEKGICRRIDFSFAGEQSVRMAGLVEDGTVEVGAIHTYIELYARMFVDLIPDVVLLCATQADRDGNLFTGPSTEDTPVIAEAAAFHDGVVVVQVNEIVDTLPRVDIPGDAQWLDRPTADALAFVGRRIESDPIVLIAALREGYDSPLSQAGLPDVRLDRLSDETSAQLLDQAFPGLSSVARERALTEAEGNPLAFRELAVALGSGGRAAETAASPRLPLTQRLEETFAARAELPAPARTLVRVAAIAEDGQLATVLTGAEIIDGAPRTIEDLMPAIRARLIDVDGQQVRFRHPLMQSAIYQAATVAERYAAHKALAGLFADDPDRCVWHRWAAAVGPDPVVAAEVEEAGRRALRRGAVATAAVAFERAAGLERDVARRGRLLLAAAAAASDLGRSETVIRLLAEAGLLGLGPHERAQCMLLEDGFRAGPAGDPAWVRELVKTASRMAALGDQDLALNLLVAAASRCYWGNLRAEGRAVILAADAIASESDDHRMLYIQAWAAPIERGEVVLREFDRAGAPVDAAALYRQGMAVCLAGGFDRAAPLLAASARRLREQGRLRLLGQVLSLQAWAAVQVGDFALAVPAAEESRRLASELERPESTTAAQLAEAQIAALRGDRAAVAELTAQAESVALPIGAPGLLSLVLYARGTLELGYGRHAEAYEHLRRIHEPGDAVESHLYRVFPKLGVSSRAQLVSVLGSRLGTAI